MARVVYFILAGLALASVARADALDQRCLPAETVWFFHVDVEAAVASILGQGARDFLLMQPEPRAALRQIHDKIGVDLNRDLQSLMVYGVNYAPDHGIIVARGKLDHAKLVALVTQLPDFRTDETSGHKLYYWTEIHPGKDPAAAPRHNVAAFFGDNQLIISADESSVLGELAVLDGKSPALAANSPIAIEPIPGAIVQAAASAFSDVGGVSPIVRQCESGWIAIGERAGEAFVRGHVTTRSADTGEQVAALMKGARALGQLQAADDANAQALLKAVNIRGEGRHVDVTGSFPSNELLGIARMELLRRAAAAAPSTRRTP